MLKKLAEIEFSLMSPDFIRKLSAVEVKNPETYDKDGFPVDGGLMDPRMGVINPGLTCKTCGKTMKECPGHPGHLELVRPVVHPAYSKKIHVMLNATCPYCGNVLLTEKEKEKLKKIKNPEKLDKIVYHKTKDIKKCPYCGKSIQKPSLEGAYDFYVENQKLYPNEIRDWLEKIKDEDLWIFGLEKGKVRPEWMVLTVLLIPPITARPTITLTNGLRSEDDLTHKLVDIVRVNQKLKEHIEAGVPQLIIEDLWNLLQYHVATYFDNTTPGIPPAKHRSGRPLKTIVQKISGKKGLIRHNLIGKRVNFSARTVVSPDPYLSINEVGVPKIIAETLTIRENVSELNIEEIKKLIKETDIVKYIIRPNGRRRKVTDNNKEEILEELSPGYAIERKMMNGDVVLFNRQPSLHRISMMAHLVRIHNDKTLKLNPIVCPPYNADFDGDEMNLHAPQTEEGKIEAKELMLVEKQILSPRYGAPIIVFNEDSITGAFLFTHKKTLLSKEEAFKYIQYLGIKPEEIPEPDKDGKYSGKLIFSLILPKDFNIEYKTHLCKLIQKVKPCKKCLKEKCPYDAYLKIENGKLISGVLDKKSFGEGEALLVDALIRKYGYSYVREFYDKLNKVFLDFLTQAGLTVGLDEYDIPKEILEIRDKAIKEEIKKGEELFKKYKEGKIKLIPGKTLRESFESYMMRLGAETKQKVEDEILSYKLKEVIDEMKYNTSLMILSGARGKVLNLTAMMGLWGQASVREGRPLRGYKHRVLATFDKHDLGPIAGGFISHSFKEGLSSLEFFFLSMGARQGEVDTGVSTKISGYLYRRLSHAMKDLRVDYSGLVISPDGRIVQYIYGDDNLNPMLTSKGDPLSEVEIKNLLEEEKHAKRKSTRKSSK